MKISTDFVPSDFGRVGVLYGGTNSEREVSLQSGAAVLAACRELGLEVVGIDIGEHPIEQIQEATLDWAFNALHGGIGEDGTISSILDALGIAYCSSDASSSAVSINKIFSKSIWLAAAREGINVPEFVAIDSHTSDPLAHIHQAGLVPPLVIKPTCEGSSVGVSIVENEDDIEAVLARDLPKYRQLLIERCITGSEYTVGIIGTKTLPVIGICTQQAFYDYSAKYLSKETKMLIPSGLPQIQERQIADTALNAFLLLGCSIWGRVDFICDDQGTAWLLEVNTVPGMTSHSLVPRAAQEIDLNFCQLVASLFSMARLERSKMQE